MNQARPFCIEYGLAMRVGTGGFHTDIRRHLGNLDNDLTQTTRNLLNGLLDDLAYIESRVKALSARIEAIAHEDETICRPLTISGIGALGATALVAWLATARSSARRETWRGSSKRGNAYRRRLIIHGARSCFLHLNRENHALGR